jgi:hypothetical protein
LGDDSSIVCIGGSTAPLGTESLGINPLGGDLVNSNLPPKFRVIQTMPIFPYCYEYQISFAILGVDQQWELIGFGTNTISNTDTNTYIKK